MENSKSLFDFVQGIEGLRIAELEVLKRIIAAKIKYLQSIDNILSGSPEKK